MKEYLVDNSLLQAETAGVTYRLSRNLDDRDMSATTGCVPWGSKITGFNVGDGWFQVGDRYLPTHIGGMSILSLAWSPAADSLRDFGRQCVGGVKVDKAEKANNRGVEQEARMKELFKTWDSNGDGLISKQEFATILNKLCAGTSAHDLDKIFASIDVNG